MGGYRESFRFSNGEARFDVCASTVERPGGAAMLVLDVLSKPRGYSLNRVFEIGGGCGSACDARRLAQRLVEETFGCKVG